MSGEEGERSLDTRGRRRPELAGKLLGVGEGLYLLPARAGRRGMPPGASSGTQRTTDGLISRNLPRDPRSATSTRASATTRIAGAHFTYCKLGLSRRRRPMITPAPESSAAASIRPHCETVGTFRHSGAGPPGALSAQVRFPLLSLTPAQALSLAALFGTQMTFVSLPPHCTRPLLPTHALPSHCGPAACAGRVAIDPTARAKLRTTRRKPFILIPPSESLHKRPLQINGLASNPSQRAAGGHGRPGCPDVCAPT